MKKYKIQLEAETPLGEHIVAFLTRHLPDEEISLGVAREKARAIETIFPSVKAYVFRVTVKNEIKRMRRI